MSTVKCGVKSTMKGISFLWKNSNKNFEATFDPVQFALRNIHMYYVYMYIENEQSSWITKTGGRNERMPKFDILQHSYDYQCAKAMKENYVSSHVSQS